MFLTNHVPARKQSFTTLKGRGVMYTCKAHVEYFRSNSSDTRGVGVICGLSMCLELVGHCFFGFYALNI